MRLMEDALILTSVARVMETMWSWERSWVGVPVRWGSYEAARNRGKRQSRCDGTNEWAIP